MHIGLTILAVCYPLFLYSRSSRLVQGLALQSPVTSRPAFRIIIDRKSLSLVYRA